MLHPTQVMACAAASVVLLAGCTAVSDDGTRSGGKPPPVVLTIGTDDAVGRPASNQIEELARQVDLLSDGSIRIEPRFRAAGEGVRQWDQKVARMVVAGDLDLGMVPARAWDTEGVLTLRALNAPLAITTTDHMNAVVSDDDLSEDLMAGLADTGVTGLALVPEATRHLVVLGGAEDVIDRLRRGGTVRSPLSRTTWAFFEALGATPTEEEADAAMVAAESELALTSLLPTKGVVGNLPLFPKVNSIVVNSATFEDLSSSEQDVLRRAATATRDWAVLTMPADAELAAAYCRGGGTIMHDDGADSPAVQRAARRVIDDLRQDATTAELIDRIAGIDPGVVSEPLEPCGGGRGDVAVTEATMTPTSGELPDGVYRVEFSDSYLRSFELSDEMVRLNHGVWTITVDAGQWSVEQDAPDVADSFSSFFEVRGEHAYWGLPGSDDLVCHTTWSTDDDRSLRFEVQDDCPSDADFHFGRAWQRIGDVRAAKHVVTADNLRPDGADLPDGSYRAEYTEEFLASRVPSAETVRNNRGVWTFELRDGRWAYEQVAPDTTDAGQGRYQVEGQHLYWELEDGRVLHLVWRTDAEGALHFDQVRDDEADADPEHPYPDFQFDLPWSRVG
ncbi:MAG TPA: hypothetical protein VFY76_07545 [Nocardioides sp.]|nr:hypothetical protein [Nocardioides sp.]